MPKFFVDNITSDTVTLDGEKARHISKSLRMKVGEEIVLCNGKGMDYGCIIESISSETVTLKVAFETPSNSESETIVDLYQGLPKGDKMGVIVQKCTELGIHSFHPVIMERSISRPDEKSSFKKCERLNKISAEAAKQSRRGIIPKVWRFESYKSAVNKIENEKIILFYEQGGEDLKDILLSFKSDSVKSIAILIGPEGGFDEKEVEFAKEKGAVIASLGNRILRTETAPIAATANILYELS